MAPPKGHPPWGRPFTSDYQPGRPGGRLGTAQREAFEILLEASPELARALVDLARSDKPEASKLAAIKDALDRAGIRAPERFEIHTTSETMLPEFDLLTPSEAMELQGLMLRVEEGEALSPSEQARGRILASKARAPLLLDAGAAAGGPVVDVAP